MRIRHTYLPLEQALHSREAQRGNNQPSAAFEHLDDPLFIYLAGRARTLTTDCQLVFTVCVCAPANN